MTEAELLAQIHQLAHQATIGAAEWVNRTRDPKYNWRATKYGQVLLAADQIRQLPDHPPPPPLPSAPSYGSAVDAAPFAGRGIMLGSNPDVWEQARQIANDGCLEVVACIPSMPISERAKFGSRIRVVVWNPPQFHGPAEIVQAENQNEWNNNTGTGEHGICANSWTYGSFHTRVALVEAYYNEGQGLDFGIFRNYMAKGAKAVIPVCGGYSAQGRSDAESARLYASLAVSVDTPGFWMYAGESLLTPESEAVLRAWKP